MHRSFWSFLHILDIFPVGSPEEFCSCLRPLRFRMLSVGLAWVTV